MGPVDLVLHLLGFALPALAVGLLVTLAGRVGRLGAEGGRWWVVALLNCGAGLAALALGLWFFGRDGKMASYAALVVAVATSQWVCARGWRA